MEPEPPEELLPEELLPEVEPPELEPLEEFPPEDVVEPLPEEPEETRSSLPPELLPEPLLLPVVTEDPDPEVEPVEPVSTVVTVPDDGAPLELSTHADVLSKTPSMTGSESALLSNLERVSPRIFLTSTGEIPTT